jgi:hypothetical protein
MDLSQIKLSRHRDTYTIFDGKEIVHRGSSTLSQVMHARVYAQMISQGYEPVTNGEIITFIKGASA